MYPIKDRDVLALMLLLVISVSAISYAQPESALKITAYEKTYANLYRPIQVPSVDSRLTLQYKVKGDKMNGGMWGGAVFLYWGPKDYLGLRLASTENRELKADISGLQAKTGSFIRRDGWIDVRVVVDIMDISFYIKGREDQWLLFHRASRPLRLLLRPMGIVIGLGYDVNGSSPYLRGAHDEPGEVGSFWFADITLSAGEEVIFREDFHRDLDELEKGYHIMADPVNDEPVFQIVTM